MAVAKVYTVYNDDYSIYRESDFVLTNLLPSFYEIYGKIPIVYKKWDTTDPNKWVLQGLNLYILSAISGVESRTNSSGQKSNVIFPTLIGPDNIVSKYCGESPDVTPGPVKYISGSQVTSSVNHARVKNVGGGLSGNEIPELSRRNVISDFAPGDNASASAIIVYNDGQNERTLQPNANKNDVLRAWQEWLRSGKTEGFDSASTQKKILYFVNHRNGGQKEEIRTFSKLQEIFPRYFQFDRQLESDFIESITGVQATGKKYFIDGNWWTVDISYVGLWEKFFQQGLSDYAIRRELTDMGYTESQINAIRGIKGVTAAQLGNSSSGSGSGAGGSGGGGGGTTGGAGSGGGGVSTGDGQTWTGPEGYQQGLVQEISIQRSRNIFLTSDEIGAAIRLNRVSTDAQGETNKPIMYQVYRDGSTDSVAGQNKINQYVFDLAPNEISYSGFGGEWASIERVGGFPYIDWKNFKLLQISFQFTIAAKTGITADGLQIPITSQIEKLQRMSQTPFPVILYRFDTLLTNQFRYDGSGTPRGIQFVIQDLSINATQRNANMDITRATANITLQEIPIERQSLIGMPRLLHKKTKPDEPVEILDPEFGLTSSNLTSGPDTSFSYKIP